MTQIKFTDLSVLGAVNSQLENIVKYTVLIALWFELRTHLIYTLTIFTQWPFTQWPFTFTGNTQKLVTEWVIISGPQLLAHLKVGPIVVGFFLTTNCCHDRWLIDIKGEGLALCDREAEYENKVQIFPQISWVSGFSSLWVGLLGSMGGKKLLSQILTISRQSSSSYDLRFDR